MENDKWKKVWTVIGTILIVAALVIAFLSVLGDRYYIDDGYYFDRWTPRIVRPR